MNLEELAGHWALVTGASSGIGREFCLQLARASVNLVVVARRKELLDDLARQVEASFGVKCMVLAEDLSVPGASGRIRAALVTENIRVRLLINNASAGPWGRFEKKSAAEFEANVQLVMGTPVAMCREFLPDLSVFPTSVIINLSSPAALQPIPYKAVYSSAKTGLHYFSLALYQEWKDKGIYVQTLMPGPTKSELDEKGGAYKSALAELRRPPEEIVALSLSILDGKTPFVTSAKGTYKQRVFTGLFPIKFVLKTVAKMFYPPEGR